jgi:ribosomal protein S13
LTKKKLQTPNIRQHNNLLKLFFLQRKLGMGWFFYLYFIKKLELSNYKLKSNLINKYKYKISKSILLLQPEKSYIMNRYRISIYFSDLIQSFKGWRHLVGLPTNGQRTWSNGWTAYKSNLFLREHKSKISKFYYGRNYKADTKISLMAEHRNWLWKKQWPWEWAFSRSFIYRIFRKNPYKFQIDLLAIANGLLGSLRPDNPKQGKKKKKILTGYIGFDKGFTKLYSRYLINVTKKRKRKVRLR